LSPSGAAPASRVLVVGTDADVSAALHLHLEGAGVGLVCAPDPGDLEPLLRAVSPQVVVLLLPATPDASWGSALTAAQGAARLGVRVLMVAPAREVVEPLAAVAGAERALSRAEVLARPLSILDAAPARAPARRPPPPAPRAAAPPAEGARPVPAGSPPPDGAPAAADPAAARPPITLADDEPPPRAPPRPSVDLMALIDEELVEEPPRPLTAARVEVSVSLVSEHNFYVGVTRRIDSGGVFIATSMPPPVGTRVQVRLGLADGRKLDLDGEVAFLRGKSATTGRQPAGCGVRLHGLPGWAVDAVERFFLARQPIVHAPP
jgi:Tfp pilus assembly protein PilZ